MATATTSFHQEPAPGEARVRTIPFEFNGRAGEYFKIWIVNVLLTILTLGIYSAWAKVRSKRYFYGNTRLAAAAFEYLAQPQQILKGRLIAFAIFVVYAVGGQFFPPLAALVGLAFVPLLPWLVVRAHAFNARNSSYRHLRFGFAAGYGQAALVYLGLPLLSVITLGAAYPYYTYRRSRFTIAESGYGKSHFGFSAPLRAFYLAYLTASGVLVLAVLAVALAAAFASGWAWPAAPGTAAVILGLAVAGFIAAYLFASTYLKTAITNLVWSSTSLREYHFQSTLETRRMFWLYLSNTVGIALSLGLLIPWAQIRLTRYRLGQLRLLAAGELEDFVAKEQQEVAAAGEEISDFFDVDIGL